MFKDFHGYRVFEDGVVLSPPSRRTNYERRPMLHHVNSKGYHLVQPVIDGRQKMIRVHRLVAHCFLGLDLDSDYQVHHKDGDTHNNHVSNLQIVSAGLHTHLDNKRVWSLDTLTHKQCRICLEVKERRMFYSANSKYDPYSSYCRVCACERRKNSRK